MSETLLHGVRAAGVTSVHLRPPSCVTWISPSSVPAHSSPGRVNDGAMV